MGPNIIKTTLVNKNVCTTLIGIYIPPSKCNLSIIKQLGKALKSIDISWMVILGDVNI